MKIGILGGGQLGRMLALAGYPLGMVCRVLDPAPGSSAGQVAEQIVGSFDDPQALGAFCEGVDLITYEFENVPAETVKYLSGKAPVYPPLQALEAGQDRLAEKCVFRRLGIPTPRFAGVDSAADLDQALDSVGLPAVLKTRRLGYDGKGQAVVRAPIELHQAWSAIDSRSAILEQLVDFECELSILAARGRDGTTACYPLVENFHRDGILRLSIAPARASTPALQSLAESFAGRLLDELQYVGVLAIEFFQVGSQLLANEMAPRVHNSGHWTIEGAATSQFENHLRAIAGLPLGSTAPRGHSAMINFIGGTPPPVALMAVQDAHPHLYGKTPRPGRKVGHLTVIRPSAEELAQTIRHDLAGLLPAAERDWFTTTAKISSNQEKHR